MRRTFTLIAAVVLLQTSQAHSSPALYTGELLVQKVSGNTCKAEEVGKTHRLEFAFDRSPDGSISGYFSAAGIFGKFSGTDASDLSVTYPLPTAGVAYGRNLSLSIRDEGVSGTLRKTDAVNKMECAVEAADVRFARSDMNGGAWLEKVKEHISDELVGRTSSYIHDNDYINANETLISAVQNDPTNLDNIISRAYVLAKLGKLPEAIILLEDARDAFASEKDREEISQATLKIMPIWKMLDISFLMETMLSVAGRYADQMRFQKAEETYQMALGSISMVSGENSDDYAFVTNSLALMYRTTARYGEAEKLFARALAIWEKSGHQNRYAALNNLALIYIDNGKYSEAESLLKQAVLYLEKNEIQDVRLASALTNLAEISRLTGRYREAEQLSGRALNLWEKSGQAPGLATTLNNRALTYQALGQDGDAERLLVRALEINRKIFGNEDTSHIAPDLNNLALLKIKDGRYPEAEALFKQSLEIIEKFLGPEHPSVASALSNLGHLYLGVHKDAEAAPLFSRALLIARTAENPSLLSFVLNGYSSLLEKQNSPEASIFFGKQALNSIQSMRANVARISNDALQSYTGTVEEKYKRLANLLIARGRLAEAQQVLGMLKEEEYFQYVRRSGDVAPKLDTTVAFTASEESWNGEYQAVSADAAKLGKELGELREFQRKGFIRQEEKKRLAELEAENRKQTVAFNAYLERLLKALRDDAEKVARVSKEERDRRLEELGEKNLAKTAALRSTLKALGDGAVVLHYLITEDRLHIILTTPDTQVARQSPVPAKELYRKIFALRSTLKTPAGDPRPIAKDLHDLLIAPVAKELLQAKAKTLMLSLDGELRYLPFAALYDGSAYLAETYRTVLYSEVAKDKIALAPLAAWQVAAMGTSVRYPGFDELASVPDELKGIVKTESGGVMPGEIHLDADFTEKSLQEASGRNPVVHIASHFKFVPGSYDESFLLLGDGSRLRLDQVKNGSYFQESELITLSACETAMGASGKGIEIEGFGALVMGQGAKAVIATLWPVADGPTARLMADFYRLREEKSLPKAEALRQAQMALLKGRTGESSQGSRKIKREVITEPENEQQATAPFTPDPKAPYAHPYFWAPFILMGNWK